MSEQTADTNPRFFQLFTIGDVVRLRHYDTTPEGRYRVWRVVGVYLGATEQESTYQLECLDVAENKPIQVPCLILESHPDVVR